MKKFNWSRFWTSLFDGLKFFGIFMATVIPAIMIFRFLFGVQMSDKWYDTFVELFRHYCQNISMPECVGIAGVGVAGNIFAKKKEEKEETESQPQ